MNEDLYDDADFARAYSNEIKDEKLRLTDACMVCELFGEIGDKLLERIGDNLIFGVDEKAAALFLEAVPKMRDYLQRKAVKAVSDKIDKGEIEDILAEPSECLSAAKCNPDMVE